jgi:membrane fusion protein, multidrug efflux system
VCRQIVTAIAILEVAVLAVACDRARSGGNAGSGRGGRGGRAAQEVPTEVARVDRISVQREVDLAGTLLSPDQARVSSEVAGIVREVTVQLGTELRAGDVIVRLEPNELQLALDRAEGQLRQIEAQLGIDRSQDKHPPSDDQIASIRQAMANRDEARNVHNRARQLHDRGLMSQVDYDTADTRLKVADANHQAAIDSVQALKATLQERRAAWDLARKKVADAMIRAPVAGAVAERLVQPGEFIRENTAVATIVQMHPLKLRTAIQEKYAALIRPGQAVSFAVEAFPSRTFTGTIAYVSPSVDQATRTFAVEALVENQDRVLKPGFFAKGVVRTHRDDHVLAVPEEAISTLAGVSTVYVVERGKARQQQVTLGARQAKLVEITSGLKGTELLATTNLSQLATGVTVRVTGSKGDAARDEGEDVEADAGRGAAGARR